MPPHQRTENKQIKNNKRALFAILDKLQPGRRVPARRSAWHLPYIVFLERRGNDLIALNPVTKDSVTLSPESLLATDWEYC